MVNKEEVWRRQVEREWDPEKNSGACRACCGSLIPAIASSRRKSPAVAALLSALSGGWAGQIYNGERRKGITLLILLIVALTLTAYTDIPIFPLGVTTYGLCDAYTTAVKLSTGKGA